MKPESMDPHRWDSVIQLAAGVIAAVVMLALLWLGQIEVGTLVELIPAALGAAEMGRRHGRKRERQR